MMFLNLFPHSYYFSGLSGYDLIVFSIGAFILSYILLVYYNRITGKYPSKITTEDSKPLYTYKDVLLQDRNMGVNQIPISTHKSVALRIIAISLILLIIVTPLYQLLNVDHFV